MGAGRQSLDAAVAEAWQVFDLPTPTSTGVCKGCCMDPAIEADFLNHSARDLPDAYIRDWYFAAFADDLDYSQMGWLMPRVMAALAADNDIFFHGGEVALSRLPQSGFPERWPKEAVKCVEAFARAFLDMRLEEPTAMLDETLCTLGNAGLPVAPLLDRVAALDDRALAALLHRSWIEEWRGKIWQTPFWMTQAQQTEVWDWYVSPELEDRMIRTGLVGDDCALAVAELIGDAVR